MSDTTDQSTSSRLRALFESALEDYETKAKVALDKHPLAKQLENCNSVESITAVLQDQARAFGEFKGRDRIMKSIRRTVSFLYNLSATAALGDDLGLALGPAVAIQTGLGVLLTAARGVIASYNAIVDLLESIEHFLNRLDIYTKIPPTPAMDEILVKIMVELVSTLALATAELKQGRPKKFVKKLFGGEKDAELVLRRLDRLTHDEARMTAAEILKVVHGLIQDMNGKASNDSTLEALQILHEIASGINRLKRDKLQQDIRNWLSPPDPWKNHHIALDSRLHGTSTWFVQGDTFLEWKLSGLIPRTLLWIHGKPGAGKSVLCSTIIEDINSTRKRGLASLAFFYHDFREDQKKNLRGLLSSVLFQLCDQSDSYHDILSNFYSAHRYGAENPSDDSLIHCLEDIVKLPGQAPIFLIVDALDECSNASSMPSPREKALVLVKQLIDSQPPNFRICVTSRPEADIKVVLEPLTFRSIPLHDQRGQREDIENYIKSVVNMDPRNDSWTVEDKQIVIDTLTRRADGMFRWAYCQVVYLRGCHPGRIQHALAELPETLDETYERTLREINKADWELAHRLFQCVAVASRPLRVDELAEFLAFDFTARPIPEFHEGWRLEDPVKAVTSTCPSFLAVVDVGGSQIIQFSHFSVKEFLTSTRLTEAKHGVSRYHVSMIPSHTLVAQACLGILLHLKENVTEDALHKFALVRYAALHWVDHARFEDVSRCVQEAMNELFDPGKPHLAIWVSLYNAELPSWRLTKRGEKPLPSSGTPLHYATICGLHAFVKDLVVEHQHEVDSRGSHRLTALHMASLRGHEEVARVLLDAGADVKALNEDGRTPLHVASKEGHLQVVRALLEHGAPITAQDKGGSTPLQLALQAPHVEDTRVLLDHSTDAGAEDEDDYGWSSPHGALQIDHISYLFSQGVPLQTACEIVQHRDPTTGQDHDGGTPLDVVLRHERAGTVTLLPKHEADATVEDLGGWNNLTCNGHGEVARVLVEHGADVTAKDRCGWTPLHSASQEGDVEIVQLLFEHGADATAQNKFGSTPLHSASRNGNLDVARFLVERGADATAKDKNGCTPLHLASLRGHAEVTQFLVENTADATARDRDGWTPLHLASRNGHVEIARFLVERGTKIMAKNKDGWTSLHLAARNGYVDVVRFLVEHGAKVTAQKKDGRTPLHSASQNGHVEITRFLVEHGAYVTAQDKNGGTPLHSASRNGRVEVAQFLVEHGADPTAQKNDGSTPLHFASSNGHVDVMRFLVECGADATAMDDSGLTPLHSASQGGHVEAARFLVDHGADVTTQNKDGSTPLHLVSSMGLLEVARLLVEHGADPTAQKEDGQTPLHLASQNGHVGVTQILVENGADVAVKDEDGWTPFHLASLMGHMDVTRFLVEHGADPTAQRKNGWTPLHLASQYGHAEVARFLLDHGADMTTQNKDGCVPLHVASSNGHEEVTRVLLEHGANSAVKDRDDWTPLHWATQKGYAEIVRLLVEHGADATTKDKNGWTPLHLALQNRHVKIAWFLVECGADTTSKDKDGCTPLHLASQNGDVELTQFLVERGANATAQKNNGRTPLHSASSNGHVGVVLFLVEHGADATAKDKDGLTPLHLASKNGHVQVVRYLVEHGAEPTAQTNNGRTPSHLALRNRHAEVAQFLVERGADAAAQKKVWRVPLRSAQRRGHVEVSRPLVKHAKTQTKIGGLRVILRRTKNMWKSRGSLSNRDSELHGSSSRMAQMS